MNLKPSQVQKIIKQYNDAIWKIVDSMDLENLDKENCKKLKHRAIYIPGLGKFVVNRKYIQKWQNKHKKEHVED